MLDDARKIDSEDAIGDFLDETRRLHDSCITSVEFRDGRFVDEHGSMHCGLGDQASLVLKIESQIGRRKYLLTFEGVTRFTYDHDAADDGLITSCAVSMTDGEIQFACNPGGSGANPLVRAKAFRYRILD
ncbi:hypothetical protein [Burkholderia pseudomultivorans]|uniref:Uncharacterized protein n=1 Tax=Burkholderia pseudomultivorans TaxID=1207504 RepID=A0A132EGC7_9BURK|nr:hypothetical protein [Burkholderia pseudomultivorans]KWF29320.1 hypothetical protein WT56_17595 [Burkholderia pseudomultivorans]